VKVQMSGDDTVKIKLTKLEAASLKFAAEFYSGGDAAKRIEKWLLADLAEDARAAADDWANQVDGSGDQNPPAPADSGGPASPIMKKMHRLCEKRGLDPRAFVETAVKSFLDGSDDDELMGLVLRRTQSLNKNVGAIQKDPA
jgi:hypothetical protein